MEVPVYLITGFLESGKTTFIQSLMEGDDFNAGEKTLILLCEEGVEEYDRSKFAFDNVIFEVIEEDEALTPLALRNLQQAHHMDRVIVEYNGMWMLDKLTSAMPDEWIIYQEVMFADSTTFLTYNQNMRQLTFDKMKTAELVIFNRCTSPNFNKEEFHKIVRVANRKSQILYEYADDQVEPDDIKDPLPYDKEAPLMLIKDEYFAEWYRDINEEQDSYDKKQLRVKGRILTEGELPEKTFIFGRHLMTCCVEDIQFAGLVGKWHGDLSRFNNGDWVAINAEVKVEEHTIYGEEGPVLYCSQVEEAAPASPEVAEF